MLGQLAQRCESLRALLARSCRTTLQQLVSGIVVHPDRIELALIPASIAALLGVQARDQTPSTIALDVPVRLTRTGRAVRLVHDNGHLATATAPDSAIIALLLKARRWWAVLGEGELDIARLASKEQVAPSYITRVVRLAFLAPDIIEAILAGKLRAGVDAKGLLATGSVPTDWEAQRERFLVGGCA